MEMAAAEQELNEILRENAHEAEFRLLIERQDGAWEIEITYPVQTLQGGKKRCTLRGVGASFEAAWDTALHKGWTGNE